MRESVSVDDDRSKRFVHNYVCIAVYTHLVRISTQYKHTCKIPTGLMPYRLQFTRRFIIRPMLLVSIFLYYSLFFLFGIYFRCYCCLVNLCCFVFLFFFYFCCMFAFNIVWETPFPSCPLSLLRCVQNQIFNHVCAFSMVWYGIAAIDHHDQR